MKILKIFLVVIAVIVPVLTIAAVIFLSTFDVSRYKTQIINRASAALGRKVDFKSAKLDVSLKQGLSFKITDLRVADDSEFSKEDFLVVKEASFVIDILGFFRKKVNISGIFIDSPRITLIREKDGNFNVNSLAEVGKKNKVNVKNTSVSSTAALPALLISSFRVTRGNMIYIDRMVTPALTLAVGQIGLEANKISLTSAFPLVAEAAVLSNEKNIRLELKVGIDLKNSAVNVSGLRVTVDLERVTPEKIPLYFPMTKDISFPSNLKGQAQILFKDFTVSGKGLPNFSADVLVENGYLQFKELVSPVENLTLGATITQKDVFLDRLSADLGQGRLEGSSRLEDYLFTQKYNLQVNAKNLSPEDIVAQDKSGVKLEGIVSGQVGVSGSGFSPQAVKTNLSGQAQVVVLRPRLRNINVLRTVMDKITVIPGLSETIKASLPELFRQKLTQKDTILSDINLPLSITNGRLMLKEITLKADEFIFEGWGEAGFDGGFSLEGAFMIPQQLSQAMVAAVSQLADLLNANNQIYIPLKVSGNANRLEFNLDAAYIANKLLTEQGKKKLFQVLDKALGKQDDASQTQQQDTSEQPGLQKQESTPEEAIKGILQEIVR